MKNIVAYHSEFEESHQLICEKLLSIINDFYSNAESKIWHGHPVWFIQGNPIVGYSKQKKGIRLMFWSGADFGENYLNVLGAKFKDASVFFNHPNEIKDEVIVRCLQKSIEIQWDYKNLIKRKGKLISINQDEGES